MAVYSWNESLKWIGMPTFRKRGWNLSWLETEAVTRLTILKFHQFPILYIWNIPGFLPTSSVTKNKDLACCSSHRLGNSIISHSLGWLCQMHLLTVILTHTNGIVGNIPDSTYILRHFSSEAACCFVACCIYANVSYPLNYRLMFSGILIPGVRQV